MKKILITGFEPFGGAAINPALEAVKLLEGVALNNGEIVICQVPVTRFKAIDAVIEAIKYHQPDYVITVGQAGGRAAITPERVAINIDDFRIADNEGNQPIDQPIVVDGPDGYFSTLPIKAMTQALQQAGIPCQVSNTAGTFVCNHLFYGVQHYLRDTRIAHGFIHIPLLPEQAALTEQPSMSLAMIAEGLKVAAQAVIDNEQDIQLTGGTIC
ncbi:pyroglutamyl-peptidase I [Photobacterium aquimaris]|uniref:Pyrrolidone-carboxylate peptidase n=1 Tax=Photobacterium aquimaris TaxID=512643 RepID=A0A1B8I4D7_9GAMM|nr:pyroglutamyl-peptidase I [Photobacterium aquimaris]MCP4955326.1 pyroglutamyl-peptidase I [Photobacterium aquimaris]OBU25106.1 pyroglutamyl-peptidase I [Photobacterium aquimaris]PQJ38820.1 pyroglutamyl-peptidase I [Photobacterium aquimaris]PSU07638.1 pyroglutamyl-peptidase I [Photobacterium aquimaris]SMY16313.1 Pyrrolidone-carboxylate peptidase [Photobacterium aquimaris]